MLIFLYFGDAGHLSEAKYSWREKQIKLIDQ